MTAALPMGSNKITGMAEPAASTDGATKNYVDTATALLVSKANYQNAAQISATAGGSSDVITASFTPTVTALTAGMTLEVRAAAANTTTIPTFQADATTAKTIIKGAGYPLVAGDIAGAGHWLTLTYDLTLDKWVLQNPANAAKFSFPVPAAFKNLSIKVATNTTVVVAADFVTTTDGVSFQTTALSGTVNLGTTGANALDAGTIAIDTWYFIWAIAKADGTTAGLASTSSTSPTMPTGYTYKARIGAVQTIHGSATLYGTWQLGRRAQYVVGLAQTATRFLAASNASSAVGSMTVGASLVAVQVTGNAKAAPATASVVFGSIFGKDGSTTNVVAAPNNNFGANTSVTNPPPCVLNAAANGTAISAALNFLLESNSIYWACNSMTIAAVAIDGWEDNI